MLNDLLVPSIHVVLLKVHSSNSRPYITDGGALGSHNIGRNEVESIQVTEGREQASRQKTVGRCQAGLTTC